VPLAPTNSAPALTEASQFSSQLQKKVQAVLKAHNIKGAKLSANGDDTPAPVLRNVAMHIAVIKNTELPSGETTMTEVCTFDRQVPFYDARANDSIMLSDSYQCPIVLNGESKTVGIMAATALTRVGYPGAPESDAKALLAGTTISEKGTTVVDFDFSFTRDLQTGNLMNILVPKIEGTSGTNDTVSVIVDMNELQ
jgi:hypothetical protein